MVIAGGIAKDDRFLMRYFRLLDIWAFAAGVVLLTLLYISSLNVNCTVAVHVVILPVLALVRNWIWPQLQMTNFYASWAAVSFAVLIVTFQFEVVPYLEIYVYENAILSAMSVVSLVCTSWVRSQSPSQVFSPISRGSILIQPPKTYISYIKVNLSSRTRPVFLLGCLFAIGALIYGAQLSTTTICHPALFQDMILIPDDCSDVYSDGYIAFAFSCSIYCLFLAMVLLFEVMMQLLYCCCCSKEVDFTELKTNEC